MTASAVARLAQLLLGLVLFGVGLWLGLVAGLGVGPWDVLTGGLSDLLGTSFGRTAIGVSVVVLLASPLLAGLAEQAPVLRLAVVALGIATVAVGSALYLGAHLGPGPRDGLMVAIADRTGWPVGAARAVLECSVLLVGVLLGGPVGVGTVLYAFGIGPAVQAAFRLLRQTPSRTPLAVAA